MKSGCTRVFVVHIALRRLFTLMWSCCVQELVSVRVADGELEGDMAVLGQVTHKLVCVPDFETMLDDS